MSTRGRPKKTTPRVRFGCMLDASLEDRLRKHLFSELEGKVPHGAYSEFMENLVRQFFDTYDGGSPAETLLLELGDLPC